MVVSHRAPERRTTDTAPRQVERAHQAPTRTAIKVSDSIYECSECQRRFDAEDMIGSDRHRIRNCNAGRALRHARCCVPPKLRRLLWIAPNGSLHHLRSCSGGDGRQHMRSVQLTEDEWAAHADKCRCAQHVTWKDPGQRS